MKSIISVTNLSKNFKNIRAVEDLSFTVNEGDVYGFLGQNGAGKSTTIRMLLTLIKPTSGLVKIFGLPLETHRKEILKRVGAIIEKPDVYKYLSAFENLKLFSQISGKAVTSLDLHKNLEMVGLSERAHDKVKTFSQGMKQRLGIAIALAHDPELVILDEPTNGLDPQGIADIRNLILHLSRERKKTILVSSHLLNEIEQVATRILIIDKGRKMVEGDAQQLFDPAQTIVELNTSDNIKTEQLLQQGSFFNAFQQRRNNHIILKMHSNKIPGFHKWLIENDVQVFSIQPRHSLEDYFLQVTSGNQHVESFTDRVI